jgi:flavin-dependent dehydrogenase
VTLDGFPIIGGGPAGAAAALVILQAGGRPEIYEKSPFPRHKLCGEFFTPEVLPVLEQIGAAGRFLAAGPARVTHAELHFQKHSRRFRLPEPAFGLSRYVFDDLLLRTALGRGAALRRRRASFPARPAVWAIGRWIVSHRGRRAFGFKAHFDGPAGDAVELFFFEGGYCGLCAIEGGRTNVCGLAGEDLLREYAFAPARLLGSIPHLRGRLAALTPATRWHISGPLRFGFAEMPDAAVLAAGDAVCFVDPFSGSGLLGAVQTGAWAGNAAVESAEGADWRRCCLHHRQLCFSFYRRQLAATTIIRRLLSLGWAEPLAGIVPPSLLFRLTRPGLQRGLDGHLPAG